MARGYYTQPAPPKVFCAQKRDYVFEKQSKSQRQILATLGASPSKRQVNLKIFPARHAGETPALPSLRPSCLLAFKTFPFSTMMWHGR
jgi:hypothetical protein